MSGQKNQKTENAVSILSLLVGIGLVGLSAHILARDDLLIHLSLESPFIYYAFFAQIVLSLVAGGLLIYRYVALCDGGDFIELPPY